MPWVGLKYVIVAFPGHTHFSKVASPFHMLKGKMYGIQVMKDNKQGIIPP